eukprot:scaffold274_cov144-Skeletonema_menzelii.AAC.27
MMSAQKQNNIPASLQSLFQPNQLAVMTPIPSTEALCHNTGTIVTFFQLKPSIKHQAPNSSRANTKQQPETVT